LKITQLKESFSGAAAGEELEVEELPEAALEWEDEENDA
jgi:hypothetical protein